MYAAAWLLGEFADLLPAASHQSVMAGLLHENVASLPEHVQSIYLQSALKIYVTASGDGSARERSGSATAKGGGGEVDLLGSGQAGSEAASVAGSVSSSVADLLSQADTAAQPGGNATAMSDLELFAAPASSTVPPPAPTSTGGGGGALSELEMFASGGVAASSKPAGASEDMDQLFGDR